MEGCPQSWTLLVRRVNFRCTWHIRQASEVLVSDCQTGVIESLDIEKRGVRIGDMFEIS